MIAPFQINVTRWSAVALRLSKRGPGRLIESTPLSSVKLLFIACCANATRPNLLDVMALRNLTTGKQARAVIDESIRDIESRLAEMDQAAKRRSPNDSASLLRLRPKRYDRGRPAALQLVVVEQKNRSVKRFCLARTHGEFRRKFVSFWCFNGLAWTARRGRSAG